MVTLRDVRVKRPYGRIGVPRANGHDNVPPKARRASMPSRPPFATSLIQARGA